MTRNSFAIGRASPLDTPHTSINVTHPNPTVLAMTMASRARPGPTSRAIQFKTGNTQTRTAENPKIRDELGRGVGGNGTHTYFLRHKHKAHAEDADGTPPPPSSSKSTTGLRVLRAAMQTQYGAPFDGLTSGGASDAKERMSGRLLRGRADRIAPRLREARCERRTTARTCVVGGLL